MAIGNIITRNAAQYPDKEAIVFLNQRLTWKQLNDRINKLADAFLKLGLQKGDKVALWSENTLACVEANYALAKIGVVYFPVLSRLLPSDVQGLIDLADAKVLLFHGDLAGTVEAVMPNLPKVQRFIQIGGETRRFATDYETFLSQGSPREPEVTVNPEDIYIFLCTGGTTGTSKIAMLTHANAMWAILTTIATLNLSEKDVGIQVLPLFHVIINNCLNSLFAAGAKVILQPSFDTIKFMEDVHNEKVSVVLVVPPFLFNWIAATPEAMAFDQGHVRVFGTAAATFPVDLKRRVMSHFPNADVYYTYGLTESSGGASTCLVPERQFDKDGSIGVVNPILSFRIVNEKGEDVQPGQPGELLLKGPSVIQGYYKREDETEEAFRDGWLQTGDMVTHDREGFLYFVDRRKDMIKTGGENVFAKEVEDALLTSPLIQEVSVFGMPDEKWGERIHAAVVLSQGQQATEDRIIAFAKEKLPGFKCPKAVLFVAALPRNPSGKVLKYKLQEGLVGR